MFAGRTTNSGSSGTKYALKRALMVVGLATKLYAVNSCSLHNDQTSFKNGMETVLGKGGAIKQKVNGEVVKYYKKILYN